MSCVSSFIGRIGGDCGYCKDKKQDGKGSNEEKNTAQFLYNVPVATYEALINMNWRRCSTYYYQPLNDRICCPQYAIRMNVTQFIKSKSQKRVEKKLEKQLLAMHPTRSAPSSDIPMEDDPTTTTTLLDHCIQQVTERVQDAVGQCGQDATLLRMTSRMGQKKFAKQHIHVTTNFAMMVHRGQKEKANALAALIVNHLLSKTQTTKQPIQHAWVMPQQHPGVVNIQLKPEAIPQQKRTQQQQSKKKKKKSPKASKPIMDRLSDLLDMSLHRAAFSDESYALFKAYQEHVHQDEDASEEGYRNFLCEGSLIDEETTNTPLSGYGTFHLTYRLQWNKRLVGVSVLDVLPGGLSSVYFFYDPAYEALQLGKFSVLYEIDLMRREQRQFSSFTYMYLGFYIHDCVKMRYKAQYQPCQLLCPITYTWVDFEKAKKVLDQSPYGRFADQSVPAYQGYKTLPNTMLYLVTPDRGNFKIQREQLALSNKVTTLLHHFHDSMGTTSEDIAYFLRLGDLT